MENLYLILSFYNSYKVNVLSLDEHIYFVLDVVFSTVESSLEKWLAPCLLGRVWIRPDLSRRHR